MIELLTELKEDISSIFTGELFDDPANAGDKAAIQVDIVSLGPKRSGQQNEEDFPFLVIRPKTGAQGDRDAEFTITILGGIYTTGDVMAGFTDLDRVITLLSDLRKKRVYGSYKMQQQLQWRYGDKDGRFAHPYYDFELYLGFNRAKNCMGV